MPGCGCSRRLLIGSVGSVGMWAVVVALPSVQAEFNVARADASMPYTLAMLGFGGGAVLIGQLVDRFGIVKPVVAATLTWGWRSSPRGSRPTSCCSPSPTC